MNPFQNIKDSSVWYKPESLKVINSQDNRLYIGIVRAAVNDATTKEIRYLVEVRHKNDTILTNCRMLRSFGGAYNYEDFVMRGYDYAAGKELQSNLSAVAGDLVLVSQFGGNGREGVIIGALNHYARQSTIDATKGPQYKSEFNGIETSITEEGEYTLTFKGQPTNLDKLKEAPGQAIPKPEYDKDVGSSYFKWDKTGSFTIDDNATDDDKIQRFFMDKKNGTVQIDSGKISLKFAKKDQAVTLTTKTLEITSKDSIKSTTKVYTVKSDDKVEFETQTYVIKASKIMLGSDSLLTAGVTDGVVTGQGIDTLTGTPYALLGSASTVVFAKK